MAEGVATLERLTTSSPLIDGVVLRYGIFMGPESELARPRHRRCDAAAAAVLALEKAQRGIYNIAEPSQYLSTEKAQREPRF